MSYMEDPRVYFASERTLLAWLRTGMGTMGLGFMVARFGMFLHMIVPDAPQHPMRQHIALGVGVAFVLFSSLAMALASVQFQRFVKTLKPSELPPRWIMPLAPFMSWTLSICGVLLALYLLM